MIVFKLPTQLRAFADGRKTLEVEASTVAEAFHQLDQAAPMIRSQVVDATGNVRPFVGVFVNSDQLTSVNVEQSLPQGSQISIVLAVAGG